MEEMEREMDTSKLKLKQQNKSYGLFQKVATVLSVKELWYGGREDSSFRSLHPEDN